MFTDYLKETLSIFAPLGKVPNLDYMADRHAIVNNEDPNKIWQQQRQQQQQMPPQMLGGMPQNQKLTAQLLPKGEQKPSLNQMVQA